MFPLKSLFTELHHRQPDVSLGVCFNECDFWLNLTAQLSFFGFYKSSVKKCNVEQTLRGPAAQFADWKNRFLRHFSSQC